MGGQAAPHSQNRLSQSDEVQVQVQVQARQPMFYTKHEVQVQVQVQVCFTSVGGQVQPMDVALRP
jgi:hypothetical protein